MQVIYKKFAFYLYTSKHGLTQAALSAPPSGLRKLDRPFGQINGCPEASCGSGCLWISIPHLRLWTHGAGWEILFVLYLVAGAGAGSVKAYSGTLQTNFASKASEFQTWGTVLCSIALPTKCYILLSHHRKLGLLFESTTLILFSISICKRMNNPFFLARHYVNINFFRARPA